MTAPRAKRMLRKVAAQAEPAVSPEPETAASRVDRATLSIEEHLASADPADHMDVLRTKGREYFVPLIDQGLSADAIQTHIYDVVRQFDLWGDNGSNSAAVDEIVQAITGRRVEDEFEDDEIELDGEPTERSTPRITFAPFKDVQISKRSRYLVKGILPNEGLVVVWGAPKCGKSFQIFDMTAHVAAGWNYRGRKTKQCPVVYFALEGQEGFSARIQAFRQANNVTDLPFYLSADRIVLPRDGLLIVNSIREQFADVRPGIVVLDTLNRSIAGSENEPADMGQYVRAADAIRDEFGCVVIIIHHCGTNENRPRGHTSLTGAADAQLAVKRDSAGNVVMTVELAKDGPQGDEIVSRLKPVTVGVDEDGDPITSCVVEPVDDPPRARQTVTGQAAEALRILAECVGTRGEIAAPSPDIPPGTRTFAENAWRAECYAKMFSEGADQTSKQKGFVRASKALQQKNLIGKHGDVVWLA